MEDLQDKIIELMDLFDGEVTTADKIDRPQRALDREAIDDFMKRNPMAGGGMLVQPSADKSRPGYAAPKIQKPVEGAPARVTFDEEKKLFRKRVQETVGGKKKSKYIYSNPGESLDSFLARKPVRATEAADATVGARKFVDNWTKSWFDNNLKNYGVRDFDVMIDDLSKAWNTRLESGDAPKAKGSFNLSTPELGLPNVTSGRDAKIKKGAIEPFSYNNVKFYANLESSKEQLSKTLAQYKKIFYKNKIETNPRLRGELNRFFDFMAKDKTGLYRTSEGQTISKFMNTVSDDAKFLLDGKASGLDKSSKNEVFNAYEDLSENYNKFTQDKARLNAVQRETEAMAKVGEKTKQQYLKVKEAIKNQNKVLAKMSVEDIANNKQLLNSVRMVIDSSTGKVSFTNYTANDPKGKPELNDLELAKKIKQKAVDGNFYVAEHISKRSLEKANTAYPNNLQSANYMSNSQLENARRFLLNPENRNTPAAQNLDKTLEQVNLTIRGSEYGGTKYGNKTNIVFDSKTNRSSIVDSQLIDTGGSSGKKTTPIKNLMLELASTVTDKCAVNLKADGGRIGYSLGSDDCFKIGKEALDNGLLKGFKNKQQVNLAETILKAGGGLKSMFQLKNIFGPAAIVATVAAEGGFIGYDMLTSGKTLREAFGDNILNYALGKDYQIDPQEEAFKRYKSLGYSDQQIGSIKKALDAANTINTGVNLAKDVATQREALEKLRGQSEEFMIPDDQMMADFAGQRAEQKLKDAEERLAAENKRLKLVDRPGGMTKEDVLSEYFSSGKYAEDLDLLDEAQKAAIVQQKSSVLPTALGEFSPKFEESRIQTISENLPFGGANPAFNIPVNGRTYGEGLGAVTFIPGKTTGGLFGLAEGGRAGYRLGKIVKPKPSKARTDVKSIIDENIKLMRQMKETGEIDEISSDLNQVIKKALDEDLFDKKDRIVDSINISEAKIRKNYPYNQQVFEEPKNLDFYRDIKESNFRTKTGEYFDRIRRRNKAGGGLLKQAGDRSGAMLESMNPDSQGLPGLLKRGMKI